MMPTFRVTAYIITDWTHDFEAADEQEARDLAYKESECDIPLGGHIEFSVQLIPRGWDKVE